MFPAIGIFSFVSRNLLDTRLYNGMRVQRSFGVHSYKDEEPDLNALFLKH
jgi:hypothetical protein